MSMIPTPDDATYPWYVRLILWLQRRKYGAELEPARLWGRSPRVFLALTGLYRALDRVSSPIEPALRSLITVRVSQINWCEFCVDLNSATALERSVEAAKLSELADFDQSPRYSAREKAALRYAETVTITGRRVDAARMSELKAHFSDDAIIELTALIAFQNLSSKFNAALHVPAQGFCRMPPGPADDAARQASQRSPSCDPTEKC
ncbi:carboxymuconolactone decarboxylase family protein [Cupriavidus sp. IK-TO18]|uniref:carboxymuconolactone decarboxylase family protein n=1 Tax=Cupriavidus sp. IK-TO18 TaxID=2782182 RepID=UPI001898BD50|nr:carboxymuconolactone decarboxylase family protein [Cupriavidus sp. IK-TO18]MBF6989458.1 carboxymuconolactone decarboxylase family protein [Cupriavidus sp. IK-TO18]